MVIRKFYNLQALESAAAELPRRHRARGLVLLRHLVDQAYFAPGHARTPRGDRWKIGRGDLVTSRSSLAAALKWTGRGIQTMLIVLVRSGLVSCHSTRRGTLVSVIYYDKYHEKGAQQDSAADRQGARTPAGTSEKVLNRQSPPPQTPPKQEIIIKQEFDHSLNSKPLKNTILPKSVRRRLFSILRRIDFRSDQGRSETLQKLEVCTPWVKRERVLARAYLIQATRGRIPRALAYKFFTEPRFSPADVDMESAKAEEFPQDPRESFQESRQDTLATRRDAMLRDLAAHVHGSQAA